MESPRSSIALRPQGVGTPGDEQPLPSVWERAKTGGGRKARSTRPAGSSTPEANRSHVDIWVRDVDKAIGQVEAIGGTLKRAPSVYPRPHSYPGELPSIDWAVMQDPFGNEFCVISVLTGEESEAVARAGEDGSADDHHWRVVAGRAAP